MEAKHTYEALINRCYWFMSNDLGFESNGMMEVAQLADL